MLEAALAKPRKGIDASSSSSQSEGTVEPHFSINSDTKLYKEESQRDSEKVSEKPQELKAS